MANMDRAALIDAAIQARSRAWAPYSKFAVGAALLSRDGRIFTGCNVENLSYGLTICAERNAIFHAVAEGVREFAAIAVVADTRLPISPCGACRQVMAEFASPNLEVVIGDKNGKEQTWKFKDLLPLAFTPEHLIKK